MKSLGWPAELTDGEKSLMQHLVRKHNLGLQRLGSIASLGKVREESGPESASRVAELKGRGLGVNVV